MPENPRERLIAIGDVHGCATALATLIEAIQPTPLDTIVPLGDYIDRGPDSRGVIDQLIALGERCTLVPLLGNHEEMLLAAFAGQSEFGFWMRVGGAEALASYGRTWGGGLRLGGLLELIPPQHLRFIKDCHTAYETVGHIFVHAYYDAHLPLGQQSMGMLRWASLPREPKPHISGKVAVVGHSAQASGEILDFGFLKCIDTFCHGGGWLTALEVNTGQVWQANEAGRVRQ